MGFSGTVSTTVFDTRRVIENAMRRCRMPAATVSSEHVDIANDQLFLLLSDLANQGAPLWCIEKLILPIYAGVGAVPLPASTVDVLNSNLRWLQQVTGTETTTLTSWQADFATPTSASTIGILWSGNSVPIVIERSDDGATWIGTQNETPAAADGEWTWYDLDNVSSSRYLRVYSPNGNFNFAQVYAGNTPTEIPLARLNRDDYTNLPNKAFQSNRPLQFWFDRQIPQPIMRLWPVPDSDAEVMQIVAWRQRYIMDVGTMTQELEVPQRWYEAIVSMLAARLAMEVIEVDANIIPMLDAKAERALAIAQMEERDNSPMNIAPNIAMYTR